MKPGDLLYVPEGWYHQVEALEGPQLSINTWVEGSARTSQDIEAAGQPSTSDGQLLAKLG